MRSPLPSTVAATRSPGSAGTATRRHSQPGCARVRAARNQSATGCTRSMAEAAESHSGHSATGGANREASASSRENAREGWADVASLIASTLAATQAQRNHHSGARSHAAASAAESSARAGLSAVPMPSHQAPASSSQRGGAAAESSSAPIANWVDEVGAALDGPFHRDRLLRIWRENFLDELPLAKDGVSVADIAWARAHEADTPRASVRDDVVARLNAALRARRMEDGLVEDCLRWLHDAAVLSRVSQLAWFVGLEEDTARAAVPSPYPARDLGVMWAKLTLSPLEGPAHFDATQLAYREFTPLGTPWRYGHLSIADALPQVFGTTELLAFEATVATDCDAVVADPSHLCHELWHVLLFAQYVRQLTGVPFADEYVVLAHQLPRNARLRALRGVGGRPRRPLLVHARDRWFVHQVRTHPRSDSRVGAGPPAPARRRVAGGPRAPRVAVGVHRRPPRARHLDVRAARLLPLAARERRAGERFPGGLCAINALPPLLRAR